MNAITVTKVRRDILLCDGSNLTMTKHLSTAMTASVLIDTKLAVDPINAYAKHPKCRGKEKKIQFYHS